MRFLHNERHICDPKQIAAALKAKTGYPACMLCTSNVGFAGNAGHPARQTLRISAPLIGDLKVFLILALNIGRPLPPP